MGHKESSAALFLVQGDVYEASPSPRDGQVRPHSQGEGTEEGSAVQSWDRPRGHVISWSPFALQGGLL
eukprot:2431263-Rhodomonas_salina.1